MICWRSFLFLSFRNWFRAIFNSSCSPSDVDSEDTTTYLKLKSEAAELSSHFSSLKSDLSELTNQKAPSETPPSDLADESTPSIEEGKKSKLTNGEASHNEHKTSSNELKSSTNEHIISITRELATPVHIEEIESIRGPSPVPGDFVPVASPPVFVDPLRNSVVEEGAKFTFKCKWVKFTGFNV